MATPRPTKKSLIDRITTRTKLKRLDVKNAVQEMLEQIIVELQRGNRLEWAISACSR